MDQPHVEEGELATDLRNLAWINRLLGGIAVIRAHLPGRWELGVGSWELGAAKSTTRPSLTLPLPAPNSQLPTPISPSGPERWTVLDVATGGGDIPRWMIRRGLPVEVVAADLHPQMLRL